MRRKEREITDSEIIAEIFAKADVCRVAFADNNIPYIVTLNYGYQLGEKPALWFHCAREGRKLEMMAKNNYVCFEMDADHLLYGGSKACSWGMRYKSVVGYGKISEVSSEDERIKGLSLLMEHYGVRGPYEFVEKELVRTTVLKLEITEMTGKKA
jgi:uncharacterized protein